MFSTGHLTSGLAVGLALGLSGDALVAFVLASVLTDWDYAFSLWTGTNHRRFLTHSPPVVAMALVPMALAWPLAWWVLAGAMLHFFLDLWDFGVRLNPFRRDVVGFRLLDVAEDANFPTYLGAYFRNPRFLAAEVAFALAAAGLAFLRF